MLLLTSTGLSYFTREAVGGIMLIVQSYTHVLLKNPQALVAGPLLTINVPMETTTREAEVDRIAMRYMR